MIYLFLLFLSIIFYTYFIFPISVILLSKNKKINYEMYQKENEMPSVSILISAHNEQEIIKEKVLSIINCKYPTDKYEIIVGSDNSSDETNNIIKSLSKKYPFIQLITFNERLGKSGVVNKLVKHARNNLLILTDANIIFSKNTIFFLLRHFKNNNIGLIDSNMINIGLKKSGISLQEKTYISSEVKFKNAESKLWGILMGPFGGCFAFRKELFKPIPKGFVVDDFFICMNILLSGYNTINDLEAIVYEDVSNQLLEEFRRKRRISRGNFNNLYHFKKVLLNPCSRIGFIFISHKVLRWVGPILLLFIFLINYYLISINLIFKITFYLQLFLFLIPFFEQFLRKLGIHIIILRFITHFYIMNLALFIGMFDYLISTKKSYWKPTKRRQDEI